jgi:hypothetical protein
VVQAIRHTIMFRVEHESVKDEDHQIQGMRPASEPSAWVILMCCRAYQ